MRSARARATRAQVAKISHVDLWSATAAFGKGHPQRFCLMPPGMARKPGAQVCELCHGKGHGKTQCTSKGGGKWTDPSLNQKGKGAGNYGAGGYGAQGAQGKGKGKYGSKGFGKSKG